MKARKFYPDQVIRKLDEQQVHSLNTVQRSVLNQALLRGRKAGRVIRLIDGKIHIGVRQAASYELHTIILVEAWMLFSRGPSLDEECIVDKGTFTLLPHEGDVRHSFVILRHSN